MTTIIEECRGYFCETCGEAWTSLNTTMDEVHGGHYSGMGCQGDPVEVYLVEAGLVRGSRIWWWSWHQGRFEGHIALLNQRLMRALNIRPPRNKS